MTEDAARDLIACLKYNYGYEPVRFSHFRFDLDLDDAVLYVWNDLLFFYDPLFSRVSLSSRYYDKLGLFSLGFTTFE